MWRQWWWLLLLLLLLRPFMQPSWNLWNLRRLCSANSDEGCCMTKGGGVVGVGREGE